eukprot:TRINITY_DN3254_c5_g1_i1.p1 TRINITY_DN3254_c5_g1~~TRINITY_DN3254_c5_g1_i1.p1  ORF type:complete len:568 (+),score=51.35 TRINITY_DN3254_c5_g1_i1:59-1705(+)
MIWVLVSSVVLATNAPRYVKIVTAEPTMEPTTAPNTIAPQTMVPEVIPKVSEGERTALERGGEVTAVLGGTNAGAAAQLALIAKSTCGGETELSLLFHPTQIFGFKTVNGNPYTAALLGNYSLLLTSLVLTFFFIIFLKKTNPNDELTTLIGKSRCPSVTMLLFLILYQGNSFSAIQLIWHGTTNGEKTLGAAFILLNTVLPLYELWVLYIGKTRGKCAYFEPGSEDPVPAKYHWLTGRGEWVSGPELFSKKHQSMLKPFGEGYPCGTAIEYVPMTALSVLFGSQSDSRPVCGHFRFAAGIASYAVMLLVCSQPSLFSKKRDWVAFIARYALQGTALVMFAVGFYSDSDGWFQTGSILLIIGLVVILVKSVLDAVGELIVIKNSRRTKLEKMWGLDRTFAQTFVDEASSALIEMGDNESILSPLTSHRRSSDCFSDISCPVLPVPSSQVRRASSPRPPVPPILSKKRPSQNSNASCSPLPYTPRTPCTPQTPRRGSDGFSDFTQPFPSILAKKRPSLVSSVTPPPRRVSAGSAVSRGSRGGTSPRTLS